MLYNDESSKKRTISSLAEQREILTSLSPHQAQSQPSKRIKLDSNSDELKFDSNVDELKPANESIIEPSTSQQSLNQSNQYNDPQSFMYPSTSSTDPSYVISSSLNYVYDGSQMYAAPEELLKPQELLAVNFESGFQPPTNFINYVKNSDDPWNAHLHLDEPYDPNARCFYPKHMVYPGNGQEYSLEELKSQKWQHMTKEKQMQHEMQVKQETEALRQRQEQERLRQEQEARRLIEEQTRIAQEQEAQRVRLEQEKMHQRQLEGASQHEAYQSQMAFQQQGNSAWTTPHSQSPANYGSSYYPQYSYSHDHRYQSHFAQQQHNLYQQSPQHYQNSPNYHQNSPNFHQTHHQQQSVIVNRSQYETQHNHIEPYYHSPHYSGNGYHEYHNSTPQMMTQNVNPAPIAHISAPVGPNFESPDYQDVEYLIDHQGEIDPNMLQQPIIESFETVKNDEEGEESSYDESDEEPYSGPTPVVNSYMLDDLEEQIEATTIKFSSNGKSRDKKITIKFRKEKTSTPILNSESNSESSMPPVRAHAIPSARNTLEPSSTSSSSSSKKKSKKQKFQSEILNTFEGDNTQFMPSATNSSSSTLNGEFNSSFGHISFNGCVTPSRKPASKMSTPVSTFKYLRKPESMVSNQNDDSISSYNADQNSFFQAENDEDLKGRRLEKALATIEEHLARRDIDPFNSELCRAFLVKLNFPNREIMNDYKITSTNLPKLSRNQVVPINGINYQIEKEVGRGSYGAVYR